MHKDEVIANQLKILANQEKIKRSSVNYSSAHSRNQRKEAKLNDH